MSWRLAPPFLLRSAGFAARLVEEIAFVRSARAIDELLDAEAAAHELASVLKMELRPAWATRRDSGLRWKTLQKRLEQRQLVSESELSTCRDDAYLVKRLTAWNEAVKRIAQCRTDAMATFEREMSECRASLRAIARDERFREAVFLSSPSMLDGLQKLSAQVTRSSEDKRLERQVAMYLQRLTTKNETTSFFGPIGYGRFTENAKGEWPITWKQEVELGHRETFVAHWAVSMLAAAIARVPEVRQTLAPRIEPTLLLEEDTLVQVTTGRRIPLKPSLARLLARVDGTTTVAELGHSEALAQLEAKAIIGIGIEIPITETRAFEALLRFVASCAAVPAAFREGLAEIAQLKSSEDKAAALGRAQEIFVSLTGSDASRSAGEIYADRSLFYEECRSGREEIEADGAFTARFESQLGRLLDLFARHGVERAAFLEKLGREIFTALFPNHNRVPFLRFVSAVQSAPQRDEWITRALSFESNVERRLRAIVRDRARAGLVRLTARDLAVAEEGAPSIDDTPLLCSPDVMIARKADGSAQLVLGEAHDTLMLWGWALGFHPDKAALAEEMWRFAEGLGLERAANLLPSRRKKIVPFEYPGTTLELAARSTEPRNPKRPLAEVAVVNGPDGIALEGDLRLHNGELYTLAHSLFALPRCVPFSLDLGPSTPRILFEDVVVQRARRRLTRAESGLQPVYPGTSFALFEDMRRMKRELGVPERVFVKLASEPKPFFVDFRSFFLLEAWEALFSQEASCVVSEMLPDTNELWLTDHCGEQVTSELRTSFGRPGRKIDGSVHAHCAA